MKPTLLAGVRILVLGIATLGGIAMAQDDAAPQEAEKAATSPDEVIAKVMKDYDAARQAFFEKYRAAKDNAERQKIYQSDYPKDAEFAKDIMKAVRQAPADASILEGLLWAMPRGGKMIQGECMKILAQHHMKSAKMGEACMTLGRARSLAAEKMLRNLMADSPHHEVRGKATYALAKTLNQQGQMMAGAESGGLDERARQWLGEEVVAKMEKVGAAALNGESEKLLETVAANYDDVKQRGDRSIADAAKADLFEMRNLAIGKTAPDIEGKDLDGVAFKLSDYRGKVVMIDFWGDW